jgi:hypothetical protein
VGSIIGLDLDDDPGECGLSPGSPKVSEPELGDFATSKNVA